jgi:uncharacterized protein (TIGR00369 family)
MGTRARRSVHDGDRDVRDDRSVRGGKDHGQQAVGVSNITDFVRPHQSGRLHVRANAIHQGRTQQLWEVEIRRPQDDKLVARGHVRLQNIDA